ncbi:DUF3298 and DUF4163 domain-containing protein [uncultured Algibacter sp.]|uniref:DUF3298 and DUF4163 domain-containing protein n=1 Tax=uncultured Algibacter sp. TaxID=298659 RepID=UPI002630B315|nr:DUF3298 and DUF4163 domain-containing protein [uncultured Algibacter sp.]
MRCYKYLIPFCCLLVFFSCKEEQKTIFIDTNITTKGNSIVEVNIPQFDAQEIVSNQINSEIQNIVIAALQIGNQDGTTSTSIEESIDSFNNEYKTFKSDFPESSHQWEAQIDGEVMYQSSELISVAITAFTNTGGAHGNLNITFLNFNSKTGQRIKNNKLFKDIEAFKTLTKPFFKEATKGKSLLQDYKQFKLPANIGYSEDGIVLLYNTFEIAPYSTGIIEFVIPFENTKSNLVFNSL